MGQLLLSRLRYRKRAFILLLWIFPFSQKSLGQDQLILFSGDTLEGYVLFVEADSIWYSSEDSSVQKHLRYVIDHVLLSDGRTMKIRDRLVQEDAAGKVLFELMAGDSIIYRNADRKRAHHTIAYIHPEYLVFRDGEQLSHTALKQFTVLRKRPGKKPVLRKTVSILIGLEGLLIGAMGLSRFGLQAEAPNPGFAAALILTGTGMMLAGLDRWSDYKTIRMIRPGNKVWKSVSP